MLFFKSVLPISMLTVKNRTGTRKRYLRCLLLFTMLITAIGIIFITLGSKIHYSKHNLGTWLKHTLTASIRSTLQVQTTPTPQMKGCKRPHLDPFDTDVMKFMKKPEELSCKGKEMHWLYVKNYTLYKDGSEKMKQIGEFKCNYTEVLRNGEFGKKYGKTFVDFKNGTQLSTDYVTVKCENENGKKHEMTYFGVVPKPEVIKRPIRIPETGLGLDVIMIGFDSTSRSHFIRKLPKTYNYLKNVLKMNIMEGYNIRTDGTTNNLFAILTGKLLTEMPESRKGYKNPVNNIDNFPFIWKEFEKYGYVTQYFEDDLGTYTWDLRLVGFKNQATDHFNKHLLYEIEKYKWKPFGHTKFCLGEYPRWRMFYRYMKSFFTAYPDRPKFSFHFAGEFSHDDPQLVSLADDDILDALTWLYDTKVLDNALLMVYSDHGSRFSEFRGTLAGRYEERNPMMSFRLPEKITTKYPKILKNLETNEQRLTSNFDIHETLLEVLNYQNKDVGDLNSRGISLFQEIPLNRTCKNASIPFHYCSCLEWETIDTNSPVSLGVAYFLVSKINELTAAKRDLCSWLTLKSVQNIQKIAPNKDVLTYQGSEMGEGFKLFFSKNPLKVVRVMYRLKISVSPSDGEYEATVTHDLKSGKFLIDNPENTISRINKYGDTANCIVQTNPMLRKFCFCKKM